MRIAIHLNQFDGRGTGKAAYDYGIELRDQFGHDVTFVTSAHSENPGLAAIRKEFDAVLYDGAMGSAAENRAIRNVLSRIADAKRFDFMYFLRYGTDDHITPDNCKTGIHCVFDMSEPHGSVYAGVSRFIAAKFGSDVFVPHIVRKYGPSGDLRPRLGIPADATVVGRHGGRSSFDIAFVHDAVRHVLSQRDDIWFVFLATERFHEHRRIIYLPWVQSGQAISDFIAGCDVMLHGRMAGKTFGLAVAEFSIANKPVMTWSGCGHPDYDTCHLELLGDRALLYHGHDDLLELLLTFDRRAAAGQDWDRYSRMFNARDVMQKFNSVFLQ